MKGKKKYKSNLIIIDGVGKFKEQKPSAKLDQWRRIKKTANKQGLVQKDTNVAGYEEMSGIKMRG